jgi:hypothetical protein
LSGPAQQFPFVARDRAMGPASLAPVIPLTLQADQTVAVSALLDTGAAVNVLPYSVGTQLGFLWDQQTTSVELSGNLASVEARVVLLAATVAQFPPVRLAFAWAKEDSMPVILGQVNFFMEFDVCFFRSRSLFEVRARS